jgi:hypothetical protein
METFLSEGNFGGEENPDHGRIMLLHHTFSDLDQVPHTFFLGSSSSDGNNLPGKLYRFFWGEQKSEIRYDVKKRIRVITRRTGGFPQYLSEKFFFLFDFIQSDAIKTLFKIFYVRDFQKKESLFISGFVPMTKCDYSLELEQPEVKGFVIIQTPCGKIIIDRKNAAEYSVESFFTTPSKKISSARMVVPAKDGKISLNVIFDGVAKTNTISGNEKNSIITPFYSLSSSQLKYPSFSLGYIKISTIALPDQGVSTTQLFAVTQSAPRKLITPLGAKNLQPLGFDGPHEYSALKNGILYMEKYGCRGTLWFDIEYLKDKQYITYLKGLMNEKSWEAGIHYSKSLTTLSQPDACALVSDEYDMVSSALGTPPKSWCSLRSRDTVFFANHLFEKYAMIWRNGETGVHAEPDIGNLDDSTWEWWNPASKAGMIHPVFTHQTDREPAILYSISFSRFKTWIDNYLANGISIIPFYEWWMINANTNDIRITGISVTNTTLKFRVKTNGERGLINVDIPAERNCKIIDTTTKEEIGWTQNPDNSITLYVHSNHGYEIFRDGKMPSGDTSPESLLSI